MKRPSFQFYPADWQANSNLRRCTHAEKGVWISVMCLMHDSEEYGILRWTLKEIAQAVGCPVATLTALRTKGVLKGVDQSERCEPLIYVPRSGRKNGDPVTLVPTQCGPVWYSSRMVVDEYKRMHSGGSTRFSPPHSAETSQRDASDSSPCRGQGEPLSEAPCPRRSDGATSTSTSTSSTSYSVPNGTDARAGRAALCAPKLPDGLPEDAWRDWVSYRKSHKSRFTAKAAELSLRELAKLYAQGFEPRAVIEQSIVNGWTGLFPLKSRAGTGPPKCRQNSFETINYREGIAADGSF